MAAVTFYRNGQELQHFTVRDLIKDLEVLPRSISHYRWLKHAEWDETYGSGMNGLFTIETLSGEKRVFDVFTIKGVGSKTTMLCKPNSLYGTLSPMFLWVIGSFVLLGVIGGSILFVRHTPTMHGPIIKLIGGIYAIIALAGLPGIFYALSVWRIIGWGSSVSYLVFFCGWCGVWGTLSFSFLTLKKWGRSMAFFSNGILMAIGVVGFIAARIGNAVPTEYATEAVQFLIVYLIIFGGLFAFCLWSPVKRLMTN